MTQAVPLSEIHRRNWRTAKAALGKRVHTLCSLVLACVLTWPPTKAMGEAKLIDSKVWASGLTSTPPAWLDSHRVLFLTGANLKMNERVRSLAIWNTKGRVELYRANVNEYCLRDGMVVYKVVDPQDHRLIRGTWYSGRLGEEKPIRNDSENDIARIYDPLNCKIGTAGEVAKSHGKRRIVPLLEEHGYLDLGAARGPESMANTPVRYIRVGAAEPVTLPFGRRDVLALPVYYPFDKSYLLPSVYFDARARVAVSPWPKDIEHPIWLVNADGKSIKRTLPKGPWTSKDDPVPHLSRVGLILARQGGIYDRTDGIYLFDGSRTAHLISGRVGRVGVSADGCALAFSHAPRPENDQANDKNRRTLKAIHLCKGGTS